MKLYPTWHIQGVALQFYVALDDQEELWQLDAKWKENKAAIFKSISTTLGMARAIRLTLGIEGSPNGRFCRVGYESDGMYCVVLFGPAYEAALKVESKATLGQEAIRQKFLDAMGLARLARGCLPGRTAADLCAVLEERLGEQFMEKGAGA